MELDFYPTYLGKPDNIFKKLESELRICKRIVTEFTPKARVAWFVASLNAPEESPEGKVNSHRNVLKHLAMNIIQKTFFLFDYFNRAVLIVSRKAFLFRLPCGLSFLKQVIIKPSATIKGLLKSCGLFMAWEKPVSESLSHIYTILVVLLNINNYLRSGGVFAELLKK